MKRVLQFSVLGVVFGVLGQSVQASDWRPAEGRNTAAVQLGKPQGARQSAAPAAPPRHSPEVRQASTSHLSPLAALELQPTSYVVRGQSPDGTPVRPTHGFGSGGYGSSGGYGPPTMAVPGSPEEQYNCGVVSEGPPVGGGVMGAPSSWMGGIGSSVGGFFGNRTNFLSDHAFDNFISPVSNPFFFEDPRSLTELRPIFIYQKSPFLGDANTQMFALQARVAITDRWSLTLNKLGFVAFQSESVLGDEQGLSELNFGIKYTFWRDEASNTLMAFGLQAELPIGSSGVFQNTGSTSLTPYFSFGQQFGQNWHFMGTAGYRFRLDDVRSESFFLSAHLDYSIFNRFFPLIELNWYHVARVGNATTGGAEGFDLFNLGAAGSKGQDLITLAAGLRFKITEAAQAGIVFEFPLSDSKDVMDYRITADFILRY